MLLERIVGSHRRPPKAAGGATKELWVPATVAAGGAVMGSFGDLPAAKLTDVNHTGHTSFFVPADFTSITDAKLVVASAQNNAAHNWDIRSDYGAVGQSTSANSEADTTTTYNANSSEYFEIDISGILSVLAAADYVGIEIMESTGTHDVNVLGIRLKYT